MLHKAAQSNQQQQSADAFRGPATQAAALAQTASLTLPNGEPPSSSRLGRSGRTDEQRVCIMAQQTKRWACRRVQGRGGNVLFWLSLRRRGCSSPLYVLSQSRAQTLLTLPDAEPAATSLLLLIRHAEEGSVFPDVNTATCTVRKKGGGGKPLRSHAEKVRRCAGGIWQAAYTCGSPCAAALATVSSCHWI